MTSAHCIMRHDESVARWSDNVNSPLQMDWYWLTGLKGCSCKWMQRIISWRLLLRKGEETVKKAAGQADFTSCSHTFFLWPLCQQVSIVIYTENRPSAACHLTAEGDLVRSDLKVPPDWFCPHSGEWWIKLAYLPVSIYVFGVVSLSACQTEPLMGT